jgi:lantibiotic modifying enzyme
MNKNNDTVRQHVESEIVRIKGAIDLKCDSTDDPSFEAGILGLALFYIFYSAFTDDKKYLDKAEGLILKAFRNLNAETFQRSYKTDTIDNQLAHFGRFIEFSKQNNLIAFDVDEYLLKLDSILFDLMKSKADLGNFDYQSGALAAGFYLIDRVDEVDDIREKLSYLLFKIEEKSISDSDGGIYWTLPTLHDRVYLGISHGSALMISFICNVLERRIEVDTCSEILSKAIKFLMKQESDFGKGLFPNYLNDSEPGPKQFSLCYGDIGIGYALLRTGQLLGDRNIEEIADRILLDCLNRKKEDNLTLDASITYGAAGLATTFEKIFRYKNDDRYLKASNYWYEKIVEYPTFANEYAGYKSRVAGENDSGNLGFSWGIAGIGVALMRSLNRELPDISSLMLIA